MYNEDHAHLECADVQFIWASGGFAKQSQAAQQLAAANGKRFDQALARAAGATAATCAEAMPVIDVVLEAIR
ncbi:MAG: hypothetical protein WKG03_02880 [Telluria sp.]